MNQANREEVARLARKGLTAEQIYLRMQPPIPFSEVEEELTKLSELVQVKARVVRRAEILVFEIYQTWNGKEWVDSDTSNVITEEDFAEARVGDEIRVDRLGQLAEDLLEFAKANATRMEITNAKEE